MGTHSNAPAQLAHENGGGHCRRHSVIPSAPVPVGAPPRHPRGLRPCDPTENQSQNLSKKENMRQSAPSRWSGPSRARHVEAGTKLARTGTVEVKQLQVLGAASLAGLEVIIDGRF